MASVWQLISQHPFVSEAIGLWLLSAIVSTMPIPAANSGTAYLWLYNALHAVAANLDKLAQSKGIPVPPDVPTATKP